jgi:hypothetical protein
VRNYDPGSPHHVLIGTSVIKESNKMLPLLASQSLNLEQSLWQSPLAQQKLPLG